NPFANEQLTLRVVRRETDHPAADHTAAFTLKFFGKIGFASAVAPQVRQVCAGLLSIDIDNRRDHRWPTGPQPMRRNLTEAKDRRRQRDGARSQIGLYLRRIGRLRINPARTLNTKLSVRYIAFANRRLVRQVGAIIIIEQAVTDQRGENGV